MTELGVAIIGPGLVAETHAAALAAIPNARLSAVYGRDPARARAFAARHGARVPGSLEQTLSSPDVQAVIVCTPHPTHAELTVAAARAGRHALVEKPLALTTADADRAIAAARAARVKLAVVSQRRLYEPVQRVAAALRAGKLGAPALATVSLLGWRGPEYYAMAAWRGTWAGEGGGVLVNQAVHLLDLLCWLAGPPEEVTGRWANLNHPDIEVEDTAVATVRFANGALGSIVASNSQNPGLWGRLHLHGTNGASVGVRTDGGSSFVAGVTIAVEPPTNDLWTVPGEAHLLPGWQAEDRARGLDVATHYHRLVVQDFVNAVLDDREPLVPGEQGRQAVALIEGIYRSGREGGPVRLASGA